MANLNLSSEATEWLVVYFQPIYDISETPPVVYAYEALLRVIRGGVVSSAEHLILEAERCGAIVSIDCWVLGEVATLVKQKPATRFSVNASQLSLQSQAYLSEALKLLAEQRLGSMVSIEVTETAHARASKLSEHLRKLHSQAIPVFLDDILDGHAQRGMLSEHFVSGCKISRQSTMAALNSHLVMRAIQDVIEICHAGNKVVVIEGIETQEELNLARQMGLRLCQGYYFQRPKDSEALFGIPGVASPARIHFEFEQEKAPLKTL